MITIIDRDGVSCVVHPQSPIYERFGKVIFVNIDGEITWIDRVNIWRILG